jgi:pyruvate formate lyase activating enzyme
MVRIMKHYLRIGGFIELSTVDIPSRACCVVFLAGCNFDCIFCQNSSLIPLNSGYLIELKELENEISTNILIDSVSITGGEPLLQPSLIPLCQELKKNFYVSVDTNGSDPKAISELSCIVDRIALDLKCDLSRYSAITHSPSNMLENVIQSFGIINSSNVVDFEVRTTIVPGLILKDDIKAISRFLTNYNFQGLYVLQQFWNEGDVRNLKNINPPTRNELIELAEIPMNQGVQKVAIRTREKGYEHIS